VYIPEDNSEQEFHNLYSSPNIIRDMKSRRMRWAGHVARMGEEGKLCKVLAGNPEGNRPLGRLRHRWEDGIGMGLREIGWEDVEWVQLTQDRGQCECGDEPSGSGATELVNIIQYCI
jgi:hypothetical protein